MFVSLMFLTVALTVVAVGWPKAIDPPDGTVIDGVVPPKNQIRGFVAPGSTFKDEFVEFTIMA